MWISSHTVRVQVTLYEHDYFIIIWLRQYFHNPLVRSNSKASTQNRLHDEIAWYTLLICKAHILRLITNWRENKSVPIRGKYLHPSFWTSKSHTIHLFIVWHPSANVFSVFLLYKSFYELWTQTNLVKNEAFFTMVMSKWQSDTKRAETRQFLDSNSKSDFLFVSETSKLETRQNIGAFTKWICLQ